MDQVADSVLELRDLWESRSDDFPFFTLGKSAYLDGNTKEYFDGADKLNPVLMKTFRPLYKRVTNVIGNELGEKIFFKFDLALPAFHIFPSDKKLLSVSGNWHIDNPHTTLELGEMDTSAFTLPVMLPTGGGGMEFEDGYYPYTGYMDEMRISKGIARWTTGFTPPTAPYSTGDPATAFNRYLLSGSADISGQPAGTSMKYKIETLNQSVSKIARVYGTSMAWA